MRRLAISIGVGLALVLAAPAMAADSTVDATNSNTWSPSSVTIDVDDTVTWKNQGGFHNVVFDDGSFTSPSEPSFSMWTASRKFTNAGTFKYHCGFHGTAMAGSVVVQGGTQPPPGGGGTDVTPPDIDDLKLVPATFCNRKTDKCKTVGAEIEFTIDEDAKIVGRIYRRKDGKRVGKLSITATAGENSFDYSGKGLALGKYRLELTPKDSAGNKPAKPSRASFKIASKR